MIFTEPERQWDTNGGFQKGSFEEGQTVQWPNEKGQIIIYKTLHRKLNFEQIELHRKREWPQVSMWANAVDKQKMTNNKWQTFIYKHYTNDRATPTPQKTKGELMCSWSVSSSCSTCETRRVTVKRHEHHLTWKSCWTSVYINTNSINKTRNSANIAFSTFQSLKRIHPLPVRSKLI